MFRDPSYYREKANMFYDRSIQTEQLMDNESNRTIRIDPQFQPDISYSEEIVRPSGIIRNSIIKRRIPDSIQDNTQVWYPEMQSSRVLTDRDTGERFRITKIYLDDGTYVYTARKLDDPVYIPRTNSMDFVRPRTSSQDYSPATSSSCGCSR